MVRTRTQDGGGALQSLSNARVARPRPAPPPPRAAIFAPGLEWNYDPNVGRFDDDVSTLDLDGSVGSPSVASDGFVHIGDGDDESQISEPAEDIMFSDDEEDRPVSVIVLDEDDHISVIEISSDEETEGEDDDDISELDLGGDPSSTHNSAPPSPHNSDPDRTISAPPTPPLRPHTPDDATDPDPDRTISDPTPSPLARDHGNENQDDEMSDDGIVDFQPQELPPYVNQNPSHFSRTHRGVTILWSVAEWAEVGEGILAGELAVLERERAQRRRRATNGGRSRLARRRAWKQAQVVRGPRARVNGRFA